MGLSDELFIWKLAFSSKKKQVELFREKYGTDILSDDDFKDIVYGADARYKEEQKRKKAQHRQYLLDHKACSTCYHYSFPDCYYYATEHYYRGGQPERVDDPDRTTCKYYKRDCSK